MKTISLKQVSDWCDGTLLKGTPDMLLSSLSTDSRNLDGKDIFLALKGDRFDGHKFVREADESGVLCVIVSDLPVETEGCGCAIIHVRDTLVALQNFAAAYRRSLEDCFVLGVTGSNGKTSTKDFLRSVLSVAGRVNATKGNLNNHIGLPLTILDTEQVDRFGVWEMGMNHPGEIEILAEIARPNAAVITNIGTAHIEHMKSRDVIAKEKACLAQSVPVDGFCVMPADDPYIDFISGSIACRMISVGIENGRVTAGELRAGEAGGYSYLLRNGENGGDQVHLSVRGRHMVTNSLLAAAVGFELGLTGADIAKALSDTVLTGGRLEEKKINGGSILDDSYNANPDSMRAALRVLEDSGVTGRRIAVLGYMGELGDHEEKEHVSLGRDVAAGGIDVLLTVGDRAALINEGAAEMGDAQLNCSNHKDAAQFLQEYLVEGDLLLIKGSRAAGMEKVIEFLKS